MTNELNDIKVSIECITYNHVEYIRDALDGFLNQKTSFRFNILVFDDCSTDGTSEIVREYAEKYPEIIHAFIAPHNTYRTAEWDNTIESLKQQYLIGKYCCWCEGDDYWIDPNKLQLQYDFMEEHSDVVLTVHASKWLNCETNTIEIVHPYDGDGYIAPDNVIMPPIGIFSFATVMARREVFFFDKDFPTADILDYPFQLYALTKGAIYYFDRAMSVYRYRHSGSWTDNTEKNHERFLQHVFCIISFLKKYDNYTDHRYIDAIIKRSNWWLCRTAFLDSDLSTTDFQELLTKTVKINEKDYCNLVEPMQNAYKVLSGRFLLSEDEKKAIHSYDHIVVLGIGDYPKHVAANLDYNGIYWDGYIEMDHRQADHVFANKKVWHMNEYPYDWDQTFIVIGGVWKLEKEVIEELHKYGCEHYYAPLWYNYLELN